METLIAITIGLLILGLITWRWVVGIDYMIKNHFGYKAEDWLDWGNDSDNEDDKKQIL
jgi:hypothetical protein